MEEYEQEIIVAIEADAEEKWRMRFSFAYASLKMLVLGVPKDLREECSQYAREYDFLLENEREVLTYLFQKLPFIPFEMEEELEMILDDLYLQNLKTFQYYEHILSLYDSMFEEKNYQSLHMKPEFEVLDDGAKGRLFQQIYIYSLTGRELKYFFKKTCLDLSFWEYTQDRVMEKEDLSHHEIACKVEEGILKEYTVFVPPIRDWNSVLTLVRAYSESFLLYKRLNKLYQKPNEKEIDLVVDTFNKMYFSSFQSEKVPKQKTYKNF